MLTDRFQSYVERHGLFSRDDRILLTVSGGVDSMVLLSLMASLGYRFGVAHCNFQLRGAESDEDEVIVAREAARYGVPCYNRRFDTAAEMERTGESMEMTARRLRYAWFEELRREHGYAAIAVAHHADDSIETFFINLLRGTGLRGLTGISTRMGRVVRPLMFASRREILEYAVAQKIPFREDSSNRSTKYLRNKIRLGLIPRIREINPKFTDLMRRNIERLTDTQLFIDAAVAHMREDVVTQAARDRHDPRRTDRGGLSAQFRRLRTAQFAVRLQGRRLRRALPRAERGGDGPAVLRQGVRRHGRPRTDPRRTHRPRRRLRSDRRAGHPAQLLRQHGALFRGVRHRRHPRLRRAGAGGAARRRPAAQIGRAHV